MASENLNYVTEAQHSLADAGLDEEQMIKVTAILEDVIERVRNEHPF